MCRIDYYDGDDLCLHPPTARRARKDHRCDDCGRGIVKGEQYTYGVWLIDGDLMTAKVCEHCVTAGKWLRVVCGGHLWPGVIEELVEHWDEEPDLRSHGLGRLVSVGRSRWHRKGQLIPVESVAKWAESGIARVPEAARH